MPVASPAACTVSSVLLALKVDRLLELGRALDVPLDPEGTAPKLAAGLAASGRVRLEALVATLGRDELKGALRAHGLPDGGRSRVALAARLLGVAEDTLTTWDGPERPVVPDAPPRRGDIVRARHRQYFVDDVRPPPEPGQATLVRMVCLDDDAQGRLLEVPWELELGAKVLQTGIGGLGTPAQVDPPEHWAAYFHALKWSQVTATDGRLFQSPFRAGIALMDYQLTPLKKALELPRANLFVADDTGAGKTIEAGLVLSELLLRNRVDFVLVVAPASVCLQWQGELQSRFGLRFEVYDQDLVAARRKERGFGVNPWETHNRFVLSYSRLRRPDYLEPLHRQLDRIAGRAGGRAPRSLLVLDEAHTAAPASGSQYAVDSHVTRVVRDSVAPRFENRLFLSATPHNGHSNSFSSLLEILDPQRFTRGVPVNPKRLQPVMVRRLKADLREIGSGSFPVRRIEPVVLRDPDAPELALSKLLAEYTALVRPAKGTGKLVFVNLQKRLMSSVAAFHRTIRAHARAVESGRAKLSVQIDWTEPDDDRDEDDREDEGEAQVEAASAGLSAHGRARELLDELLRLSDRYRLQPDAKARALLDWIRANQCAKLGTRGAKWTGARVLVFTEYGDTLKVLRQILTAAFDGSDRDDERILTFTGGMSMDDRAAVQAAFNDPDHPVRVLLCTDAAREGVNLQSLCADLFHFNLPWNPARLEQRNGRIDRTLQPAPEVRCRYFVYAERPEDRVLDTVVRKTDTIQRELGSLSAVVLERITELLEQGITADTEDLVAQAGADDARQQAAKAELEASRSDLDQLRREVAEAGKILNDSRDVMEFDPELLRRAVDVGLRLAGAPGLVRDPEVDGRWRLPELPESWAETVDHLRPPRTPKEKPWEWRRRPPRPVVFRPLRVLDATAVHLHLQHPLVQRVLARFQAQGFGAHDLSRVTIVRNRFDHLPRVLAFGRLSLFGRGAARLHDRLISVAAMRPESRGGALQPFADTADRKALELLEQILAEADDHPPVPDVVRERLLAAAPTDFDELWTHVQGEAEAQEHEARDQLRRRGAEEEAALRGLIAEQRDAIRKVLEGRQQLTLPLFRAEPERVQYADDGKHLEDRLKRIEVEIDTEPPELRGLYEVVLRRLEPVGLVYLWPGTR